LHFGFADFNRTYSYEGAISGCWQLGPFPQAGVKKITVISHPIPTTAVVLKNMEEQLLLLSGRRAPVTLVTENNALVVMRRSAPAVQAFLFASCTLFSIGLLYFGLVAIWIMLKVAVAETSLLAFVVCIVLLAAWIPGGYACLSVQGLLFPFMVRIDMRRHLYLLKNGFKVARLSLATETTISIVPVYSRGAWGYAANLKRGRRGFSWPIIPSAIIGTKYDAFLEAESVKQFIENGMPALRVSLDQWDTAKIRPKVEYIR